MAKTFGHEIKPASFAFSLVMAFNLLVSIQILIVLAVNAKVQDPQLQAYLGIFFVIINYFWVIWLGLCGAAAVVVLLHRLGYPWRRVWPSFVYAALLILSIIGGVYALFQFIG